MVDEISLCYLHKSYGSISNKAVVEYNLFWCLFSIISIPASEKFKNIVWTTLKLVPDI